MFKSLRSNHVLLTLALVAGACHQAPEGGASQQGASPVAEAKDAPMAKVQGVAFRLREAKALGVLNARVPEAGLLCSGQLTEAQFTSLAHSGYETFINLRQVTESGTGWEADSASELGVSYIHIPVAGAAGITEGNARRLAATLADAKRPVALYCGSSNRVGALYGLGAFFTEDKSPEESLAMAEAGGVTRLKGKVMEILALDQ